MNTKIDNIENYIIELAEEIFPKGELTVDADIATDHKIIMTYKVEGGIDRTCNCPWGGPEYVEEFIDSVNHEDIINVSYELDHEDLTGELTILI